MKKTVQLLAVLSILFIGVAIGSIAHTGIAQAIDPLQETCKLDPSSPICSGNNTTVNSLVKTIVNTLLFILGAISVIVIVISGIMFSTSAGDAGKVKKAKDAAMYAVIGLAIASFSYAIAGWVVDRFV